MKNAYEIFEAKGDVDLDYVVNKYEELTSQCNDKHEIESIEKAYEELLDDLNQKSKHVNNYKKCIHCNVKLNKDDIYCFKCGKNQHQKVKNLNLKRNKIVISVVALIIIFKILNFTEVTNSIGFGNKFARTPKEAVYYNLKAMDTNDIKLFIKSMDYKGIYDDLSYYCENKGIDLHKFIETGNMLLSKEDSYMDKEFGDGWVKNLKITQPRNIKGLSQVEVTVYINGQNVAVPAIKVPNRGWFVYGASSNGYRDSYYDNVERILYNDEIYLGKEEANLDVMYDEVVDLTEAYIEEEVDLGFTEDGAIWIGGKKFSVSYPNYKSFTERYISEDTGKEYWTSFTRMYDGDDQLLKDILDLKSYRFKNIQGSYIYKIPISDGKTEKFAYISDVTEHIYTEDGFGVDVFEYIERDVKTYHFNQNLSNGSYLKYLGKDKSIIPNNYLNRLEFIEDIYGGWGRIEKITIDSVDLIISTFENDSFYTNQCREIVFNKGAKVLGATVGMTRKEIEDILLEPYDYGTNENGYYILYQLGEAREQSLYFYFDDISGKSKEARAYYEGYYEPLQWVLEWIAESELNED